MQAVKKPINFNVEQIIREEVPFLADFYFSKKELNKDIRDLLEFPIDNKDAMPFYTLKEGTCEQLEGQFYAYYQMMLDALEIAFRDDELLYKFFDCSFMRNHGRNFVPYAKATFQRKQPALYGRFDACFDPETERLMGVYEFNGDTPVMLFESVNLQNRFSQELGTDQMNHWWQIFTEKMHNRYDNVAVVCHTGYVDDVATGETIAQAFHEANTSCPVSFIDLKELDFDHLERNHPFYVKGQHRPLDAVYVLLPWEEMIENFPAMLNNWGSWIDNVHLFEPAWRWFLAHKGMTALCTYLCDESKSFAIKHSTASKVLLPTYLQMPSGCKSFKWVEKPVIGRLSNNIRIWEYGQVLSDTGGYYGEENTVFQLFCAPRQVEGRNNFILGMWMCDDEVASVCAREFDEEVLSTANERWIPHMVV